MSSDAYSKRVNCTALVLLSILVVAGLVFLVVSAFSSKDIVAQRRSCIVGDHTLVFPGPGDNGPGVYWEGFVLFHLTQNTINWRMFHGGLGTVHSMEIFGPVTAGNPNNGPLYLTLCGGAATIACLMTAPNTLEQRITQTSPAQEPLGNYLTAITADRDLYKIRIKTQTFPDGALVARLGVAC